MSEQMDLPTSSGSMAAEWAGLSPADRERVAALFLSLRHIAKEVRAAEPSRVWGEVVGLVKKHPDIPSNGDALARVLKNLLSSDPQGLAFIGHMDNIARAAVAEHLLPDGSTVFGCISTLPTAGGAR
jgi:hypothetical protein